MAKLMAFACAALVIAALAVLEIWHQEIEQEIRNRVRMEVEQDDFDDKKKQIELAFKRIYESIRTVSLLPSVRKIEKGNRLSEDEDILQRGDFNTDGWETVQQIYNNLVANVSASEIYATVKGFAPEKGEVPFFMFDEAIISGGMDSEEVSEPLPPDFPEEFEGDEYRAINAQIDQLISTNPHFQYNDLNEIPMLSTSSIRTCDNSQYLSEASDNVLDSHGIVLSVPFYHQAGGLDGVISAIIRLNVIEALLMDAPFIPVTERDHINAARIGFKLPDEPSGYVVFNPEMNVYISDRRNHGIIDRVKNADPDLIVHDMNSADLSQWRLALAIPERFYDEALQQEQNLRFWRRAIFFMITLFLFAMLYWNGRLNFAQIQLHERNRQLKQKATTDTLTGIYNRSHLDSVLQQEKGRCRRYNHVFGVVMLDIDHFKQVNDRFGHLVGDYVLIEIAKLLKSNIRAADTVGRWGGEEFLIICPEAELDDLRCLAEKLRQVIASQSFDEIRQITASFGIAVSFPDEEFDLAIQQADAALYQAKAAGRNQVAEYSLSKA